LEILYRKLHFLYQETVPQQKIIPCPGGPFPPEESLKKALLSMTTNSCSNYLIKRQSSHNELNASTQEDTLANFHEEAIRLDRVGPQK
jgi:hypothetical protein